MSFSQLLELRKGKLAAKVGIDANLEEHEVFKQVEQEMQQEEMGEKVENNKSSIAKMYNSPKPLVPSKGAIRTSAGYMLVHQDRVDEDRVQEKRTKKRKLSERLEEPIEVKTSGRCRKANVNSWRNQFLTLKKKVSRMQIEAGAEPNFLIIMMNNVQDPNASNPSKSAGKYLTYGEGTIKEKFISEGLQLDESYFLLANNKKFAIDEEGAKKQNKSTKAAPTKTNKESAKDKSTKGVPTQIENKTPSLKIKKALQPQNEKRTISFKPRKVATPGAFIDTFEDISDHDEGDKSFDEDSEEGDDNEAGERNMNNGFIANTSYKQELTGNESTTFKDVTLDTL